MTILEQIHDAATKDMQNPVFKGIRRGQALMNALHVIRPSWYVAITGSDSDPFYDNAKIEAFNKWITDKEITEH